jgi:hypothetical protein
VDSRISPKIRPPRAQCRAPTQGAGVHQRLVAETNSQPHAHGDVAGQRISRGITLLHQAGEVSFRIVENLVAWAMCLLEDRASIVS